MTVHASVELEQLVTAHLRPVGRLGGVDSHLKWRQNAYGLYTRLAGSRAGIETITGVGYKLTAD